MRRTMGLAATAATAAIATALVTPQAKAQSDDDAPMASILAIEIATMREEYEARIRALEERLEALQSGKAGEMADPHDHGHGAPDDGHDDQDDHGHDGGMAEHDDHGDALSPQIAAVLRGMFATHSVEEWRQPAGFQLGHESERAPEGISLGHSELSLTSDVGDALHAALVLGIGLHPGEPAELELEEAYFRTLPGSGLPDELTVTAGRKLWSFGYLNERHAHEDDFADRPLPYRAFLDGAYNDDGVQLSLALPGALQTEFGGGLFRGDDRPFGGSDSGRAALSAFARIGGDMGRDSSWGIGVSFLSGEVGGTGAHGHGHGDENGHEDDHADENGHEDDHDDDHADENGHEDDHADENGHEDDHDDDHEDDHADEDDHEDDHPDENGHEDDHADENGHDDDMDDHADENGHEDDHAHEAIAPASFFSDGLFSGDRDLLGVDVRFAWAPTGNARQSELIFQSEYFLQMDDGVFSLDDDEMAVDGTSAGWYAQAVYKFAPQWRIGTRYSRLSPPGAAEAGHDPSAIAIMGDWTSDDFGQLRLQYNRESLASGEQDDQVVLQYTVTLGGQHGHDH